MKMNMAASLDHHQVSKHFVSQIKFYEHAFVHFLVFNQAQCIMGIVVFFYLFKEREGGMLCVLYLQNVQECGSTRHSLAWVLFL